MTTILQALLGRKARPDRVMGSPEPLLHHGSIDRLPECLRTGPLEGIEQLCKAYTGPMQGASGTVAHGQQVPLNATPSQILGLGLTAYFQDLSTLGDLFDGFLRQLEDDLGVPRGCAVLMAFSNTPGSGLPVHHDMYDQILIHLVGRKRLDVAPNRFAAHPSLQYRPEELQAPGFALTYQGGFPASSDQVVPSLETLWLEPGSALYLPGGCFHASAGQTDRTLTLVVQLRVPSRAEVFTHFLAHWLGQSTAWRSRAYGAWPGGADPELGTLVADLAGRLRDVDLSDAFAAWTLSQHGMGASRKAPDHPWRRWIRLPEARVTLDERATSGRIEVIVRCGAQVVPRFTDRFFVGADHRELLDWLLATDRAFDRAEVHQRFATPDAAAIDALLARLCVAQVLRPVPVPPWDVTAGS